MYVTRTVDISPLPLVCVSMYLYIVPHGAVVHMVHSVRAGGSNSTFVRQILMKAPPSRGVWGHAPQGKL